MNQSRSVYRGYSCKQQRSIKGWMALCLGFKLCVAPPPRWLDVRSLPTITAIYFWMLNMDTALLSSQHSVMTDVASRLFFCHLAMLEPGHGVGYPQRLLTISKLGILCFQNRMVEEMENQDSFHDELPSSVSLTWKDLGTCSKFSIWVKSWLQKELLIYTTILGSWIMNLGTIRQEWNLNRYCKP